jgi:hypothetical protein
VIGPINMCHPPGCCIERFCNLISDSVGGAAEIIKLENKTGAVHRRTRNSTLVNSEYRKTSAASIA